MKAIFYKDLRENFKHAACCFLGLAAILFFVFRTEINLQGSLLDLHNMGNTSYLQPLLANGMLWAMGMFCGVFGAALGWIQTRNEAHRDLWAFLVHRPVTRTEIFWGKALAGLCLYAFAAGAPLAVLLAVVATPGHVAAPFEWIMALPLVEFFGLGISAYFAGMLTGMRQARWYASRAGGLGLLMFAAVGMLAFMQWWESLVAWAIITGILGAAAWGAYQSGGTYEGQPRLGKVTLTLAMVAGCGVLLFSGLGLLQNLFMNRGPGKMQYARYEMMRDGTLCKVSWQGSSIERLEDLAGHELMDSKTARPMTVKEFQQQQAYGQSAQAGYSSSGDRWANPLRLGTAFFRLLCISDQTLWYLDRWGRLEGFDGVTRRPVGSLKPCDEQGRDLDAPFLANQNNNYYFYNSMNDGHQRFVTTSNAVYLVDFKDRKVKLLQALAGEHILGFQEQEQNLGRDDVRTFFFATDKSVELIDSTGRTLFKLAKGAPFQTYSEIELTSLTPSQTVTNAYAVWFYPDYSRNEKTGWKLPVKVVWMGVGGTGVTQERELTVLPLPTPKWIPQWTDKLADACVPPVISVAVMGWQLGHHQRLDYSNKAGLPLAVVSMLAGGWRLWRRRKSGAILAGWSIFIFFFGLPGWMALGCVQEWPVRVDCKNCGRGHSVDRENCEHCGAAFGPADKNGTEIFEELTNQPSLVE